MSICQNAHTNTTCHSANIQFPLSPHPLPSPTSHIHRLPRNYMYPTRQSIPAEVINEKRKFIGIWWVWRVSFSPFYHLWFDLIEYDMMWCNMILESAVILRDELLERPDFVFGISVFRILPTIWYPQFHEAPHLVMWFFLACEINEFKQYSWVERAGALSMLADSTIVVEVELYEPP